MKRALFIVGPTSVGKTEFALKISKKIPSVLISADSVQVFRGTDVISGKDIPKNSQVVGSHYLIGMTPLFLVDVADPFDGFSVYDFTRSVRKIIKGTKNTLPIIVGGTRFYIDALTKNIDTLSIPPDRKLRAKIEKFPVEKLQEELKKLNPEKFSAMNYSDSNNPRRLIRAIEVSKQRTSFDRPVFKERDVLIIGLTASLGKIKSKIGIRLDKRIKQGALDEAKKLFASYDKLSPQIKSTNGYKQLFEFLKGNISLDDAIGKWRASEYHLAKEQLGWLARKPQIKLFNTEKPGFEKAILRLIEQSF